MAARVETAKARKEYTCEKCGKAINKGDTYKWFKVGFRSNYRHTRCDAYVCSPKRSELTTSKLADVYGAMEEAESEIEGAETVEDVEAAVQQVAETCRTVADEYREAAVNPNTGVEFNPDNIERADELDGIADELESWSCDADDREECPVHGDQWTDTVDDIQVRMDLTKESLLTVVETDSDEEDEDECTCEETLENWLDGIRTAGQDALNDLVTV